MAYTEWYPVYSTTPDWTEYSGRVQAQIDLGGIAMTGLPQDNYDGRPSMLMGHSDSGMSPLVWGIDYGSLLEVGDINGMFRTYKIVEVLANPESTAGAMYSNGVNNGDVFYWGEGIEEAIVISLCQNGLNYYYYGVPVN